MSVCNIYKPIPSGPAFTSPVFYTFSEYMNDLTVNINNDGLSLARPSRFITLKLTNTDGLHTFLQSFYDDACCVLRDKKTERYREVLFGGLWKGLIDKGFMTDQKVAGGDIDLFGDGETDGMKYDEIICHLGPQATDSMSIKKNDSLSLTFKGSQYISGYSRAADRVLPDVDYNSMVSADTVFDKHYIEDTSTGSTGSFEFNAVLVLYDVELGKNPDVIVKGIPLGLYVSPAMHTKHVSHGDIYNQGTSYALRISMRFATTYDGSIYVETSAGGRDVNTFLSAADRLSAVIDQARRLTTSFGEYRKGVQDLMTAVIQSSSKTGWETYGDG